jgi:hypothetical protein
MMASFIVAQLMEKRGIIEYVPEIVLVTSYGLFHCCVVAANLPSAMPTDSAISARTTGLRLVLVPCEAVIKIDTPFHFITSTVVDCLAPCTSRLQSSSCKSNFSASVLHNLVGQSLMFVAANAARYCLSTGLLLSFRCLCFQRAYKDCVGVICQPCFGTTTWLSIRVRVDKSNAT